MGTKTKIFSIMLAGALLTSPVLVYADNDGDWHGGPGHQSEGWHHGPKDHMFAKVLNLSDDQIKQLKDLHQKQRQDMKNLFVQIKSNTQALDEEIIKPIPDMNKVNTIEAQLKTLQAQMFDNHLNSVLAIKKIMTPEQFAGYMALKKESTMKKHMMMGHHKFGHRPWGDKPQADKDHFEDGQD